MNAMAGSAVRHGLRATANGEAVETVGVGRHAIGRQVEAGVQPLIAVATAASVDGDACGADGRGGILRGENEMLAVAIGADGRSADAGFQRLAVNAFHVGFRNFGVAGAAGFRDVPVIDLGARIARGIDGVRAVTVRTGGGVLAFGNGARVDALLVKLDGVGDWNLVTGKKARIAVASGAGIGTVSFCHSRFRRAGWSDLVNGAVAGFAGGSIAVARSRLAVNALL